MRRRADDSTTDGGRDDPARVSSRDTSHGPDPESHQEREEHAGRKMKEGERVQFHVVFEPNDPDNPRNWSMACKLAVIGWVSFLNVCVTSLSSAYQVGLAGVQQEFGVSQEVATLGVTLHWVGLAIGSLFAAPLSEMIGRKPVFSIFWALFFILQFPIAFAPNFTAVAINRFLTGFAASPPQANTGGLVNDMFGRGQPNGMQQRKDYAVVIYVFGTSIGSSIGYIWTGHLFQAKGWHWIFYMAILVFGAVWFVNLFFLPETRYDVMLKKRAKKLRKQDARYFATDDDRWTTALIRPFRFLFTERITAFAALVSGILFGFISLFNTAFVQVFGAGGYGFSSGNVQITFVSLVVGSIIGAAIFPFTQEIYYMHNKKRHDGTAEPEARIAYSLIGSLLIPIGLFMFAWTCYPSSVHWIVPLIGASIFGIGFFQVLYSVIAYVIDAYGRFSASALAATILVRNLFAAGFPLFSTYQYNTLGTHWATALIAFLSLLLIPLTYWFFFKGDAVRRASPWARSHFGEDEEDPK